MVLGLIEDWYEMPIKDRWEELQKELKKYQEIEGLIEFLNKQT